MSLPQCNVSLDEGLVNRPEGKFLSAVPWDEGASK